MTIKAGTGLSVLRDPARAALEASKRALAAADVARADLVFLFATTEHARRYQEVLDVIAETTGAPTVAGCSGSGVLTQDREIEAGPGLAVLAIAGEEVRAEAGLLPEAGSGDLGKALGQLARWRKDNEQRAAPTIVLFPDLRGVEPSAFFTGLEASAGFLPVVGGAPSGRSGRCFQFGGGKVAEGRAVTTIVEAPAAVEVAVAQGCRPIGRAAVITRCEGQSIEKLAGRPALELLAEALEGAGIEQIEAQETPVFAGIAIDPRKHPLARGDFLVRPIVGVDETAGSVAVGEVVRVGQTVVFQLRDSGAATADLEATLGDLAARLGQRKARFALYFNCVGRGAALYGRKDHDVEAIRRRFPGLPVAGFFGNGELAPIGGRNFLHTYTGVLVAFCDAEASTP